MATCTGIFARAIDRHLSLLDGGYFQTPQDGVDARIDKAPDELVAAARQAGIPDHPLLVPVLEGAPTSYPHPKVKLNFLRIVLAATPLEKNPIDHNELKALFEQEEKRVALLPQREFFPF